jgi:LysM repeat protein
MPEGRAAWFVAVCVVVLGSVALSAGGLTTLRATSPQSMAMGTPTPAATALPSPESIATPSPIRTTTPIPTPSPTPTPTPATTPVASGEAEYVVAAGDGLERIAQQFGVTTEALAERNNLVPPYRLEVGQVLLIPTAE